MDYELKEKDRKWTILIDDFHKACLAYREIFPFLTDISLNCDGENSKKCVRILELVKIISDYLSYQKKIFTLSYSTLVDLFDELKNKNDNRVPEVSKIGSAYYIELRNKRGGNIEKVSGAQGDDKK